MSRKLPLVVRMGATLTEDKLHAVRPLGRAKVDGLCARIAPLPVVDARTPDEILAYGQLGIPR